MWEERERWVRDALRRGGKEPAAGGLGFDQGVLFDVARRMVAAGIPFSHDLYGGPLEEACVRLGVNVEDVFAALCDMLAEVKTRPGTDALAVATGEADTFAPCFAHPGRSAAYARVAALAYCLSRLHQPGAFFPFPRDRIAAWLGVDPHTAGRLIRKLDADGVIRLRRNKDGKVIYLPKSGLSREAAYTGPTDFTTRLT